MQRVGVVAEKVRREQSRAGVDEGEHGEIVVRASSVIAGYCKNPKETARANAFGWHHTGDIGYRDADGFCCP